MKKGHKRRINLRLRQAKSLAESTHRAFTVLNHTKEDLASRLARLQVEFDQLTFRLRHVARAAYFRKHKETVSIRTRYMPVASSPRMERIIGVPYDRVLEHIELLHLCMWIEDNAPTVDRYVRFTLRDQVRGESTCAAYAISREVLDMWRDLSREELIRIICEDFGAGLYHALNQHTTRR